MHIDHQRREEPFVSHFKHTGTIAQDIDVFLLKEKHTCTSTQPELNDLGN